MTLALATVVMALVSYLVAQLHAGRGTVDLSAMGAIVCVGLSRVHLHRALANDVDKRTLSVWLLRRLAD